MKRAAFLLQVLACMLAATGLPAQAQDYPTKPIRTFTTAPGGTPDVVGRMLGNAMAGSLGQQVVVETRPGGGGLVAIQALKQSPADGYTVLFTDSGVWAILPAMRPGSYDPIKDLIPIGMVFTSSLFLVVSDKLSARTVQEFIALAKSKPGTLSYASAGNGTLHHLFMEGFKAAVGINVLHVPFSKGSAEAVPAFLGGNTDAIISSFPVIDPHVKAGKARLLVASTQQRSPYAPEVPALADINVRGESFSGDMGYFAPAGTPKAVVDKFAAALAGAVKSPEYIARAKAYGVEPVFRGPEEFGELVKADLARYTRAVNVAGVKMQ